MANSREAWFQQYIIEVTVAGGWEIGAANGYDHATALYTQDLLGYAWEAWPKCWERFCKANSQAPETMVVQEAVRGWSLYPLPGSPSARRSACAWKRSRPYPGQRSWAR